MYLVVIWIFPILFQATERKNSCQIKEKRKEKRVKGKEEKEQDIAEPIINLFLNKPGSFLIQIKAIVEQYFSVML